MNFSEVAVTCVVFVAHGSVSSSHKMIRAIAYCWAFDVDIANLCRL